MLNQYIEECIKALETEENQTIVETLLTNLKSRADSIDISTLINWMKEYFARRWKIDSIFDFTLFPKTTRNKELISLARHLSKPAAIPFMEILIPTLAKQQQDPLSLCFLKHVKNPEDIYLSDDDKWYYLPGLQQRIMINMYSNSTRNSILSTLDKPEHSKERALTLKELWRIKKKDLEKNFWESIRAKVLPKCAKSGKFNNTLLPYLAALATSKREGFSDKLSNLERALAKLPNTDCNHVYGMPVQFQGKLVYLIELLLMFIEPSNRIEEVQHVLIGWLNKQFLFALKEGSNEKKIKKIEEIKPEELNKDSLTIQQIRELYQKHFYDILDTRDDYFCSDAKYKHNWINYAYFLSKIGLVEENYYRLLIPTLNMVTDPFTLDPINEHPLDEYILSEDKRSLIYLPNCAKWAESVGGFFNNRREPFTAVERQRLKRSRSEFVNLYIQLEKRDEPLKKATVDQLKNLINLTLYEYGLKDEIRESDTHFITITMEATKFNHWLHHLEQSDPNEYQRLLKQRVFYKGNHSAGFYRFEEIWKTLAAVTQSTACFSQACLKFAKIVVDYGMKHELNSHIQEISEIKNMHSAGKVFRGYERINNDEAMKRIQIIVITLLTMQFNLVLTGSRISCWHFTNTVSDICKKIFDFIRSQEPNPQCYALVIEEMKSILAEKQKETENNGFRINFSNNFYAMFKSNTVDSLYEALGNETLFDGEESWCDPHDLFALLYKIRERSKNQSKIDCFLILMINTWQYEEEKAFVNWENKKEFVKAVQINFLFKKFVMQNLQIFQTEMSDVYLEKPTTKGGKDERTVALVEAFLIDKISVNNVVQKESIRRKLTTAPRNTTIGGVLARLVQIANGYSNSESSIKVSIERLVNLLRQPPSPELKAIPVLTTALRC